MKQELRKKYLSIRKNICSTIPSSIITKKVLSHPKIITSSTILIYMSYNNEVDTKEIINALLPSKKIALPKVINKEIKFYYINSILELSPGYYGILEPITTNPVNDYDNTICITPGVCFSRDGYRLGYGGGYYDRFLSKHKVYTIGLCYKECLVNTLPHESHDKQIDEIITD